MSEPHVRSRKAVPRRDRFMQETLVTVSQAIADVTDASLPAAEGEGYRTILAGWPLKWRERWGRRANALEDLGMSWRSAELRAFTEVGEERRRKSEGRQNTAVELAGRN